MSNYKIKVDPTVFGNHYHYLKANKGHVPRLCRNTAQYQLFSNSSGYSSSAVPSVNRFSQNLDIADIAPVLIFGDFLPSGVSISLPVFTICVGVFDWLGGCGAAAFPVIWVLIGWGFCFTGSDWTGLNGLLTLFVRVIFIDWVVDEVDGDWDFWVIWIFCLCGFWIALAPVGATFCPLRLEDWNTCFGPSGTCFICWPVVMAVARPGFTEGCSADFEEIFCKCLSSSLYLRSFSSWSLGTLLAVMLWTWNWNYTCIWLSPFRYKVKP